jgi:hypothetical protein
MDNCLLFCFAGFSVVVLCLSVGQVFEAVCHRWIMEGRPCVAQELTEDGDGIVSSFLLSFPRCQRDYFDNGFKVDGATKVSMSPSALTSTVAPATVAPATTTTTSSATSTSSAPVLLHCPVSKNFCAVDSLLAPYCFIQV